MSGNGLYLFPVRDAPNFGSLRVCVEDGDPPVDWSLDVDPAAAEMDHGDSGGGGCPGTSAHIHGDVGPIPSWTTPYGRQCIRKVYRRMVA